MTSPTPLASIGLRALLLQAIFPSNGLIGTSTYLKRTYKSSSTAFRALHGSRQIALQRLRSGSTHSGLKFTDIITPSFHRKPSPNQLVSQALTRIGLTTSQAVMQGSTSRHKRTVNSLLLSSPIKVKRVIVTPAVYPRLVEFLHFDIQSTGQKSHCVNIL